MLGRAGWEWKAPAVNTRGIHEEDLPKDRPQEDADSKLGVLRTARSGMPWVVFYFLFFYFF